MYSYADRMRAVQLYIKLGKRMASTIRQLGYPTKNALKDWYREYERSHDLPARYVRTKPRYSPEQKTAAVEHYLSHGCCLTQIGKALGYPCRTTLWAWVAPHDPDAGRRVVGQAAAAPRTEQQKQAAVIDLCARRESAREAARHDR